MTISIKILITIIVSISLNGCATTFQNLDPKTNFNPPPVNYQTTIKHYFNTILKDPYSAKYHFENPKKAYTNRGLVYGGSIRWHGWVVDVNVNAKNSYGGYTGGKTYSVLFKGNEIYRVATDSSMILLHRLQ